MLPLRRGAAEWVAPRKEKGRRVFVGLIRVQGGQCSGLEKAPREGARGGKDERGLGEKREKEMIDASQTPYFTGICTA
jgi:hypothetical protein